MAITGRSPQPLVFLLCFSSFTLIMVFGQREVPSALVSLSNVTDQFALLSFKSFITRDPYNVLSNWNSSISFCDWNGVSCSHGSQRVVALNLSGKALEGTLSPYISNLSFLQVFDISNDSFHGDLLIDFSRLPQLEYLSIRKNNFEGLIPQTLSHCRRLQMLSAQENQFYGSIPKFLGSLSELKILSIRGNRLTGTIPIALANLTKLEWFTIGQNQIQGNIPPELGSLTQLWILNLSSNQIEGTIPLHLANLTKLIALDLRFNKIKGLIPPNIGSLNMLQELGLSGNALEGSIPDSLYQLVHMSNLYLDMNALTGPISNSINNLTSLQKLYLNSNNLSSAIPPALCELKDLIWLYLQDNSLTGHLPLDVGNLAAVDKMDISMNQLSGDLPLSLSRLQRLEYLNLSKNSFDGHIPERLDGMVNIEAIDLSHNKLSGEIPKSLEKLQHIQVLDLTFNLLEGEIPSGGKFANLSLDSFVGNYALCGAPKFHVPVCSEGVKKHNNVNMIRVDIFLASGGFALVLIVWILIVVTKYRKRGLEKHDQEAERFCGITLPVITYRMLSQATNNFSDANFLGSGSFGSVYKGILTDGTTVAVKVLNLLSDGASKSFDIECNVMCQIRHRNLLRVITSCSSADFKALVLQYMPRGSLEVCLHSGGHHLNLFQRLGIMIDVACALEYLHHGCWETIVHCDLKPSNVLLDENMTAHVGDFGIAKMLVGHKSSTLTSTLGTTGYIAPEFGATGKVSTKADVYSYGILLLEVFTRRKPTDERFDGDFTLRQWVAEAFPLAISDVIDGHLLNQNNHEMISDHVTEGRLLKENNSETVRNEVLFMIMETGLSCSRKSPTERMDMQEVVARLQTIRRKASPLEE